MSDEPTNHACPGGSDEACPACGTEPDCGHATGEAGSCHRTGVMPCPTHFGRTSAMALESGPHADRVQEFIDHINHLNRDGNISGAYYTWMALMGRYAAEDGEDRMAKATRMVTIDCPPDAPDYREQVVPLISYGCRAAIVGDGETVGATWEAAQEILGPEGLLSFLRSVCVSAAVNMSTNRSCSQDYTTVYHLLGSQATTSRAFESLPFLADMVVHMYRGNTAAAARAFEKLVELPGVRHLIASVDVVARVVAQMVNPDVVVLTMGGEAKPDGWTLPEGLGMVDWRAAEHNDANAKIMSPVWALRAAEVYATCTDAEGATKGIQALVKRHPDGPGLFASDVIIGGTQILANVLEQSQEERLGTTPWPS